MQEARFRGLRERQKFVFNPLPKGQSQRKYAEQAGFVRLQVASTEDCFRYGWKFSGGLQAESIVLDPSDFWRDEAGRVCALRESEANELIRDLGEMGIVLVDDPDNEDEVLEKGIRGLDKAISYWGTRGRTCLDQYQMLNQFDDTKMRNARLETWVYYVNEKLAEHLEKHRMTLITEQKKREAKRAAVVTKEAAA